MIKSYLILFDKDTVVVHLVTSGEVSTLATYTFSDGNHPCGYWESLWNFCVRSRFLLCSNT